MMSKSIKSQRLAINTRKCNLHIHTHTQEMWHIAVFYASHDDILKAIITKHILKDLRSPLFGPQYHNICRPALVLFQTP